MSSEAIAESVLPQHREILRSKLDAALALAHACGAERELIVEILLAGYQYRPDILVSPRLDPAAELGTTSETDSPISIYRRALAEMGIY